MAEDWTAAVFAAWDVGRRLGAVGPGPLEDHLSHAAALADAIGVPPVRFIDLGTGAGIPGLALCGLWPASEAVLVDASERRLAPVRAAIDQLGWADRVEIVHGRAEVLGHDVRFREQFPLVVARSFGPPATTAECAAPFAAVGGRCVVSEPPEPASAGAGRWSGLAAVPLGLTDGGMRQSEGAHVRVLDKVGPLPDRFPRRDGVPRRRPLF